MDCARSTQACRDAIEANAVSGAHQLHDLSSLLVFVLVGDGTPVGGLLQRILIVLLSGWILLTARRIRQPRRLTRTVD